jgi:hypothetical protein
MSTPEGLFDLIQISEYMRSLQLQSVLLVVLLVLAGCNGINIGRDEETTPVPPADVPQDLYGGTIAPGLTERDVVNAKALIRAHREILANKSVTVKKTVRIVAANGTVLQRTNTTGRYSADRSRYTLTNGFGKAWFHNGTFYTIYQPNGKKIYDATEQQNPLIKYQIEILRKKLSRVTRVTVEPLSKRDDRVQYRIRSIGMLSSDEEIGGESKTILNTNLSAVITERGFIQEYRHETVYRENDAKFRVIQSIRYRNLGNTTVKRPEWVDEAKNATAPEIRVG